MVLGSIPWYDLLPYVDFVKEIRGLFSDVCFVEDWLKAAQRIEYYCESVM